MSRVERDYLGNFKKNTTFQKQTKMSTMLYKNHYFFSCSSYVTMFLRIILAFICAHLREAFRSPLDLQTETLPQSK